MNFLNECFAASLANMRTVTYNKNEMHLYHVNIKSGNEAICFYYSAEKATNNLNSLPVCVRECFRRVDAVLNLAPHSPQT